MKERIKISEITSELRSSYLDYALSVIISRALPDVRDGLKPVQRRILYVMKELGLWPNEKFTKCANIVGNTIARYHPHGDQAVYEALVRLAQDFSMRYPLVIGQGNFGSIDGDPPAAYRYTEAKLSSAAVEMLADIEKECVDFRPNYDNTRKEPIVLPAKIPQLVLNGSLGIAVGMATNIPPHNLVEVCEAVKKLIENPDLSIKDLLEIIKGPDFPTGGVVFGKKSLLEAYKTGRGGIVIRGKVKIEETKRGAKRIVITEIPWQVNKAELVQQIANLSLNKVIPEIKEIRDESNKEGIRVVIEVSERDENVLKNIIEKIYRLTDLQKNYYFNFIALEEGIQPKLFNLKELILSWINHRREVIRRRTKYDLEKTKERIEILEGLKKALQDIDAVIRIIRKSPDRETAKKNLMTRLKINERQADAILEMPLRTLTSLETKRIIDELNEKLKLKKELETILKYPKKIDEIIIKETEEVSKKYGDKRKTEIREEEIIPTKFEEEIKEEDVLLFINQKKFVRTYKLDTPLEKILKDKENFGKVILTKTTEKLLAYTRKGKIYSLNVSDFYNSPKYLETNLIIEKGDEILDVIRPVEAKNLIIFTKNGLAKKIKIEDALSVKRTGVQVIKLKNDDAVVKVLLNGNYNLFLLSLNGFGLGIKNDLPVQTRAGSGVKVIKLQNDFLFTASSLNKNYILTIFSNGYAKKISVKEINIQKRGGKGIKIFELKEKFGELVFADCVNDDDTLVIINDKLEFVKIKNIPVVKRINQPVKITDKITKVEIL
jgi:DNA gyrase subunit A